MRQPQVARLGVLLVAFVLVLPIARAGRVLVVAALFLTEFLSGGAWPVLSRFTAAPAREALALPGASADRYVVPAETRRTPLVLVHGLAPAGKDDERLVAAARLFARSGFDVSVPTIPGLTRLRLRPDDRGPVVVALARRPDPTVVGGVSVGAGVALLAAAEPAVRDRVALVLSLGGYASAAELARFYLTGDYGFGDVHGHATHDPELIRMFLRANADVLDASARRALAAADPAGVDASLRALSPPLATLLRAVSPERVVRRVRAPLVLVHGRGDTAVPYTESLRLAAARPEHTRVVLIGVVGHVEGASALDRWHALRDLLALWGVAYRVITLG